MVIQMPDGSVVLSEHITSYGVSGSDFTVNQNAGSALKYTAQQASGALAWQEALTNVLNGRALPIVGGTAGMVPIINTPITFVGSMTTKVLCYGSGFDPSQDGFLSFNVSSPNITNLTYCNANLFTFPVAGTTAGTYIATYNYGYGGLLTAPPFTIIVT